MDNGLLNGNFVSTRLVHRNRACNLDGLRNLNVVGDRDIDVTFNGNVNFNGNVDFPDLFNGNVDFNRNRNDNLNVNDLRNRDFDRVGYVDGNLTFDRVRHVNGNSDVNVSGNLYWVRYVNSNFNWNGNLDGNLNGDRDINWDLDGSRRNFYNSLNGVRDIDKDFDGNRNCNGNFDGNFYINVLVNFDVVRAFNRDSNGNRNINRDLNGVRNLDLNFNGVRDGNLLGNRDGNRLVNDDGNFFDSFNVVGDRNIDGSLDHVRGVPGDINRNLFAGNRNIDELFNDDGNSSLTDLFNGVRDGHFIWNRYGNTVRYINSNFNIIVSVLVLIDRTLLNGSGGSPVSRSNTPVSSSGSNAPVSSGSNAPVGANSSTIEGGTDTNGGKIPAIGDEAIIGIQTTWVWGNGGGTNRED